MADPVAGLAVALPITLGFLIPLEDVDGRAIPEREGRVGEEAGADATADDGAVEGVTSIGSSFVVFACFFGFPSSTWLTCAANLSAHADSPHEDSAGLRFTIMAVFPSPLRHGASRWVSLLLRKGMCEDFCESARNTSESDDSDLLIAWVSFRRAASEPAPLFARRSLPAKSQRFSEPESVVRESGLVAERYSVNTECDLEDRSFMLVLAVARFFAALFMRTDTSLIVAITVRVRPGTCVRPWGSFFTSRSLSFELEQRRSRSVSLLKGRQRRKGGSRERGEVSGWDHMNVRLLPHRNVLD
jgi:hypothetical protein